MSGADPQRHVIAVIPARAASSRFPRKPLARLLGRPMIAHVIERVLRARRIDEVWVATDDAAIAAAARRAGAKVAMTEPELASGTDRVARAAAGLGADIVLNVQGDEPLVDPVSLDRLVEALQADGKCGAATLAVPLRRAAEWTRPDVVKVVVGEDGDALYFSRAPIPFDRARGGRRPAGALKHLGIYAYRRAVLEGFARSGPSRLERLEGLEQLRLLERGVRIKVVRARRDTIAVDRPEDVERVEAEMRAERKKEGRKTS